MWLIGKKNYKEYDDLKLISDYRKKDDKQALGVLFDRYSHLVFGVCMKYLKNHDDSKDATLSIFEKAMADLKRFEVEKFSFWIHTVARNYCLMQLRSRKAMFYYDDEDGPGLDYFMESDQSMNHHHANELEDQLQLMEEAIETLNEEQRICIDLFYLKKYCYQDVAEIGGFTLKEVKSYIQNGKRNIKLYMLKRSHEITNK